VKRLVLIVGQSGTGKNFFTSAFNLIAIPSFTTRPKRKNEINGIEHEFVTEASWKTVYSKQKNILAYTYYNNNHYWVTKEQFENQDYDVYIIDPEGVYFLLNKEFNRDYSIVYLKASIFKRIKNMLSRNDSIRNIFIRLLNDTKVFSKFEKDKSINKLIVRV